MFKILACDTIHDISLIQTEQGYYTRYGLEQTHFKDLTKALDDFRDCQSHALSERFDL